MGAFVYFSLYNIDSNFIDKFWYIPNYWFSLKIFGIPIAEYIWYFFAGAFIGPLYEYIKDLGLKNSPNKKCSKKCRGQPSTNLILKQIFAG
jgi:hypothetical protein